MARTIDDHLERHKRLKAEKDPWETHHQQLARIFLTRKRNITVTISPGEFLQDDIFDNTGQFAAHTFASALLSNLWPDASRTIILRPIDRLKNAPGVEGFFKRATEEMHARMDEPEAGLPTALMEHFMEQGVFGTSGIGAFEGEEDDDSLPVTFASWGIKSMVIDENERGFVDTIYMTRIYTVKQIMDKYGKNGRVSARVKKMFADGDIAKTVEVLQVIFPKKPTPNKRGVAAMPIGTIHIDVQHKFRMREGGFEEMPMHVVRMFKIIEEKYGRSAAMTALPDAASLNALREAMLLAVEKQLDPPLIVLDDGRLGGGVIDSSAGGLNVFNSSGRLGTQLPIQPLFTVGEFQSSEKLAEQLREFIMQAFFLDRLLDLNNQTQMTAFETSIRERKSGVALGSIFSRQLLEGLVPLIKRTFNVLYRRGHFGFSGTDASQRFSDRWEKITGTQMLPVPRAILEAAAAGVDAYDIEFISPAKRFMQAEKLQGIQVAADSIIALSAVMPEIVDNLKDDTLAREIFRYSGAPSISLRTAQELKEFRAQNASRQQAADALGAAGAVADIDQKSASARALLGTTGGGGK